MEVRGREGTERWIKHYSSAHSILLVGEGDFSFSVCLAMAFASATNIVAISLDSYDDLIKKYKNAKANLAYLEVLGASLLHGVDATKMRILPVFRWKKFHRIIFNFPHAGFYGKEDNPDLITMHRNLVRGFLMNASSMLLPDGEIHVKHKVTAPFDSWKLEDLASEYFLLYVGQDDFRIEDYPGYNNKRGSGSRSDEPFPLGECRTFKFKLWPGVQELDLIQTMSEFQVPVNMQQQPVPLVRPYTYNDVHLSNGLRWNIDHKHECHRIFGAYLNHVEQTFGSTSYDVYHSVREALRLGFEMYMAAEPGRPSSGYIGILEELHHLSVLRSQRLRQMLLTLDQQH
ncbi:Heavy metal-associated isoprenylated plant protein 41 [Sesamum angolense]|uniref:Heavy metal-associated isoprenylated plant protein 41 n=1 Tax=Sesamum angolense TaxID=2727404 RepID=A0AAE2BUX5_9LAMI|nr:Heavy metal-associated isoprenylated plant protein 41 [Sesamum angolense]